MTMYQQIIFGSSTLIRLIQNLVFKWGNTSFSTEILMKRNDNNSITSLLHSDLGVMKNSITGCHDEYHLWVFVVLLLNLQLVLIYLV